MKNLWKVLLSLIKQPLALELAKMVDSLKIPDDVKALVKAEIGKLLRI